MASREPVIVCQKVATAQGAALVIDQTDSRTSKEA